MTVEVLVTTMHQNDISKYYEMNLQTDAVIANQANTCALEELDINGKLVRFVTTDTCGVSTNRNIAITYSKADIIVFADDDQQFVDGYEKIISDAFETYTDANAIKFYCESTNPGRPLSYKRPASMRKASRKDLMSSGVPCLAIKRTFLLDNNIFFDVNLGPGAKNYCGEDSVFLSDILRRKCVIYLSPELISYVNQGESSWFNGYDEQFFVSSGFVYARLYGILAPLVILRRAKNTKKRKSCTASFASMVLLMMKGFRQGYKQR